jgi:hypothetical protein
MTAMLVTSMSNGVDWVAVSTLAVAVATALLAYAAWLSARTASQQLRRDIRPVVIPSKPDGRTRRGRFADGTLVPVADEEIYTARNGTLNYVGICLRNIGTGIAVVRGLKLCLTEEKEKQPAPSEFAYTERAIYMAPADTAYLTNVVDETAEEWFGPQLMEGIMSVYFLYTDLTNSQPAITRFELRYDSDADGFYAAEIRHWMVKPRDWKRMRSRVG